MHHGSRRNVYARSRHIAVVLTTMVFALTFVALMVPDATQAGTGPKIVRGYIWDSASNLIEGAEVTVSILAQSDLSVRATYSETTGADGEYYLSFDPDDWFIGDTIQTVATYNAVQETESTAATVDGVQWVNIQFEFEIPEFGSYLGLLIAGGAIGIVGIAVVSTKRRR